MCVFSVLRRFWVHYIGHFEYFGFHVLIRPIRINFSPNPTLKPINDISYNDMDLHAKLKIFHLNKTHLRPTSLFCFLHFLLEISLLSFTNSYSILKLKPCKWNPYNLRASPSPPSSSPRNPLPNTSLSPSVSKYLPSFHSSRLELPIKRQVRCMHADLLPFLPFTVVGVWSEFFF